MNVDASGGTVGKALDVLDRVAEFNRPVRFAELLAASPYPKGTLYRLMQTLTREGMLAFDPDRQSYSLGVRLVRLAHVAWRTSSLAPIARPHLDALAAETGETVHLAQLDQAQVLYVDKRNTAEPVEMYSSAGKVGPAYCTGVGKAMLAHLPEETLSQIIPLQLFHKFTEHTLIDEAALRAQLAEIRALGYGFDREEHEPSIICVACPILSEQGRVFGALSVTSTTARTNLAALEQLVPRIQQTTKAIAAEVQDWRFPDTVAQQVED